MIKAFLLTLVFFTLGIQNSDSTKIKVLGVETLVLPNNEKASNIIIGPDGKVLAFTAAGENVLKTYHFESQKVTEIARNAVANSLVFSPNGKHLFFKTDENSAKLQHFNFSNKKTETLTNEEIQKNNRWNWWYRLWKMDDYVWSDINLKALQNGAWDFPFVTLQNGKPVFHENGNENTLDPLGVQYYLHASLSPDKSKICAFAIGKGAFVCDTNGNNLVEMGNIEAPIWINNSLVAGMTTTDDGHEITASKIVATDIKTLAETTILDESYQAQYPIYSTANNTIICTSKERGIYLIKLSEK